MRPYLRWWFVAMALMLAGCSNSDWWSKDSVLAVPLQPTLQQEVILARMEQILASRALTDDERAQLLYECGVLYDSLGLRALAQRWRAMIFHKRWQSDPICRKFSIILAYT